MDERQPHFPAIFVCLELPYPVVCYIPNAAVLYFVLHNAVIRVIPENMERYRVDQPLFICLGVACCYPSSRLDLAVDVFPAYPINPCCTPHFCDKPLLPTIQYPSNINLSHLDLNWVSFGAAYLNLYFLHTQHELSLFP